MNNYIEQQNLLLKHFKNPNNINFIGEGYFSKAYVFEDLEQKYILRIGTSLKAFKKDLFSYNNFSEYLDIPKVLKIGQYKEYYYCISEFKIGETFNSLNYDLQISSIKSIMEIHYQIYNIKCTQFNSFGTLDENGSSKYLNWKDYITDFNFHKNLLCPNNLIYKDWNSLFDYEYVDVQLIKKCMDLLLNLIKYCPEDKHIIHGDFGSDNILINNNKVSAILDWAELSIGDPLYDIAYLDYYSDIDYSSLFKDFYDNYNISFENYYERILCYKIYQFLVSAFISLNRNLKEFYLEDANKTKDMLNKIQY